MNMRYWGTVIFATLFSWHNSRWRKATGARNPDGSCTTSSVWQQLVLPGETKNCSHAAMPVVICCGTTGRETWTRKCLQCFDVLSILSLTLLLSNVTGSRARGWNFRFAGSQAISFPGLWLFLQEPALLDKAAKFAGWTSSLTCPALSRRARRCYTGSMHWWYWATWWRFSGEGTSTWSSRPSLTLAWLMDGFDLFFPRRANLADDNILQHPATSSELERRRRCLDAFRLVYQRSRAKRWWQTRQPRSMIHRENGDL